MGINRPSNLNIRDVPGNGSIVGPSTTPSCVATITTCESCYNTCDACSDVSLGSGYITLCACLCCDIVCSCECTTCDRTTPPGVWKTSEQYEARERDAWPPTTGTSGAATCDCDINPGCTCCTCTTATGGCTICKASSKAWVVAPDIVSRTWYCRDDVVTLAEATAACGDWFVPNCAQAQNPGYTCKEYWDWGSSSLVWSSTQRHGYLAWSVSFNTGAANMSNQTDVRSVRAFRCVSY